MVAPEEARAEFRRRDHDIDTHTEIAVSPEDDIELRGITVTNRSRTRRVIDLTSYAEVVLASPAADAQLYGHLASSILYANSSLRADPNVLIKNRRGQSGLWGYSISGDLPIVLLRIGRHPRSTTDIGRPSITSPSCKRAPRMAE